MNEALDYFNELDDDDFSDSSSECDEISDLVIIPPDPDVVTDEESLDDDLLHDKIPFPKDVSGEIELHDGKCSFFSKKVVKKENITREKIRWTKASPTYDMKPTSDEDRRIELLSGEMSNVEPIDMFLKFFNEELLEHIVTESVKYAHQNNRLKFSLTVPVLKRFIGILMFTGYSTLPQEQLYWSVSPDVNCPIVRETMNRATYLSIKQNIHLADNTILDKNDKLAKVRPYLNILNKNFMQFDVFATNLSIDEQMIPYFGKHSSKMFIKGKPVRFGYKVWCLCSSNGYLFQCDIYTGKSNEKGDLGLGGDVIMKLLKVVENAHNHVVYFDNFFTSHSLMSELSRMGFCATGTIKENRTGHCPLLSVKEMKKTDRGTYFSAFDKKNGVFISRWNDNSVVTIASNWDVAEPPILAKRYSRKEKKHISLKQPKLISNYNTHMGGVDLLDNFIASYRIQIKGKKWWWPIFSNFIDAAKVNAWKLYRICIDPSISLLDFQRSLVISLLKTPINSNEPDEETEKSEAKFQNPGRPSAMQNLFLDKVREDCTNHIIERNTEGKRRRCKHCSSQTITICKKCAVPLHAKCFKPFHVTRK